MIVTLPDRTLQAYVLPARRALLLVGIVRALRHASRLPLRSNRARFYDANGDPSDLRHGQIRVHLTPRIAQRPELETRPVPEGPRAGFDARAVRRAFGRPV